jgi:hypothetical protein
MTTLEIEQVTQDLLIAQSKIAAKQHELEEIFRKAGVDRL